MHSHCRVSCKIPPCHSGYSRTKTQNSTKQCAADGCGKKSDNGKDDSLQVEFQHRLQGGDLHVEWVPHTGETPVRIFTMQPGTSHSVNTFVGHVFRVIDADTNKEISSVRMLPGRYSVPLDEAHMKFSGESCHDRHESCHSLARQGECTKGPGWMTMNCPESCHTCAMRDPKLRCERHLLQMDQSPGLLPGELEAMFSGLPEKWSQFNVTVHSRSPWVVTFDNFIKDEEIEGILSTVRSQFRRSTDQGAVDENGEQEQVVSTGRTSENAWCTKECEEHPATRAVNNRIEEIVGVPQSNFESLQILKYEKGQFYRAHHDLGGDDNYKACGPRIYTFFLYLSDVEAGGETAFPQLDIAIKPRKGSALLWPSVTSENPTKQDPRTTHEARPVIQGTKYAANAWINLYSYNVPNLWGCTGSFD